MPVHSFIHEESGETIDVYVGINAPPPEHRQQKRNGKIYRRVYSAPLAAVSMGTRHGDATSADFNRVTTGKRGLKVGDMWEISQEMSARRAAQTGGADPVKEQFYRKHELENDGEKHPDVVRREKMEKANVKLRDMGITIRR